MRKKRTLMEMNFKEKQESCDYNKLNPFETSTNQQAYNKGQYKFGDVIELSYLYATDSSNQIHEMGHYILAKSTLWGLAIKYLTKFTEYDERLKDCVEVMKDACEEVFESYSISLQYLLDIKSDHKIQSIKNSLYYKIYNKDYFDIIENIPYEQIIAFPIHARLARLALGVKLDSLYSSQELKHTLINNPQLHPDKRFRKLVFSLKDLLNEKNYIEITDQEILFNCNLTAYEQDVYNLYDYCNILKYELINSFADNQNLISNITKCEVIIDSTPFEKHLKDVYNNISIPVSGGEHYKTEYLESIPESLHLFNVMIVLFDDPYKDLHICTIYNTSHHIRYWFFFQEKDYNKIFNSFEGELVINYFDIEKYESIDIKKNRVFCCFPIKYTDFKNSIEQYAEDEKSAYIHRLHPSISTIFVKGKNNLILFSPQFFFLEPEMKKDIKNGYYNYIDCKLFQTDGIFYISKSDWEKYDSVTKAIFMAYNTGYRVTSESLRLEEEGNK